MKRFGLWAAFAALAAVATFATAASAKDWTGFYAGIQGDYADTTTEYDNPGTPHQHLKGAMLGVRAGYDYQFENGIVLGAIADASFGDVNTSLKDGNYIGESGKLSMTGALRARLGYALGDWLPYLAGGLAWDRLEQGESCPNPVAVVAGFCKTHGPFDLTETHTQTGWTIGAGVEYAIAEHWSLAGEYAHSDFGKDTFVLSPDATGAPLPPSTEQHAINTVRFAVNYRF